MDPSKATAGLRRLKDLEGITIITGFLGSPCSMAAHTLNEKLGVLLFNTHMSNKILNDGNKLAVTYGVPGHWTGYAQGKAMAEQGFKTACMVVDVADGPQEWANALEKSFQEAGAKF